MITNDIKMKVLQEILDHLSNTEGGELKSSLDKFKMPKEDMGAPGEEMDENGKPKGLKIESIQVMGKPKKMGMDSESENPMADSEDKGKSGIPGETDEKEMDDDELNELLSRL